MILKPALKRAWPFGHAHHSKPDGRECSHSMGERVREACDGNAIDAASGWCDDDVLGDREIEVARDGRVFVIILLLSHHCTAQLDPRGWLGAAAAAERSRRRCPPLVLLVKRCGTKPYLWYEYVKGR